MKKILITIFSVFLIATVGLAACGSSENAEKETGTKQETSDREELGLLFSSTIKETIIVDEQGIKITAKELTYGNNSAKLALLLENNTDRVLSFYAGTLGCSENSVNGYMISGGYVVEEVAPGSSVNTEMSIELDELVVHGFTDIADICVGFRITDENNDEYLTTGQRQIKTSNADFDYSKDTFAEAMNGNLVPAVYGMTKIYGSTDKLFDIGDLKNLSSFLFKNSDGEQILMIEAENASGENVYLTVENLKVNDREVSSGVLKGEYICDGKKCVSSINLSEKIEESLEETDGQLKIEKLSFDVSKRDFDYNVTGSEYVEIQP